MDRVIVGTAGHIDHGKTTLVRALTGIDCDRWEQEKARGITIDLGFAHLEDGDLQVGFVDVPGHERFLHNALAGLGGIRVLLLVVAADEGVKPQTREHLDICSLLEIPQAVVALTKSDLAAPDLLELAQLEVEEILASGPFAGAPIVPVSSQTGDGLGELRATLLEAARKQALSGEPEDQPARLPIDRAFVLKGIGVVVTGTLTSGMIRTGDALELHGTSETARVRGVQIHGQVRDRALAGERTSLQLTGVDLEVLRRGLSLTTPGAFLETRNLCCRIRLLPEAPKTLRGFTPVRAHVFSSELLGKLRPLGTEGLEPGAVGLVEVRLSEPVLAARGDHVILRRPSPATTLGGGVILDPAWVRPRGKALRTAQDAVQGDLDSLLTFWIGIAGEAGIGAGDLAKRLGWTGRTLRQHLDRLTGDGKLLEVPNAPGGQPRWLTPAVLRRVVERAKRVIKQYFRQNRLAVGMPKAEAVQRILPGRGRQLSDIYLRWLVAQKVLQMEGGLILQPGRQAQLSGEESKLSEAALKAYREAGLTPPSPQEVSRNLGAKQQILEGVVDYLVQRRRLTRLPGGLLLATSVLDRLAEDLRQGSAERFTVAQFKDRFELSRKWAIPLLEHLDSSGVTRRLGDERMVVPLHSP